MSSADRVNAPPRQHNGTTEELSPSPNLEESKEARPSERLNFIPLLHMISMLTNFSGCFLVRCKNWDDKEMWGAIHIFPERFPHAGLERNYCRNPFINELRRPQAWCYVSLQLNYCDIDTVLFIVSLRSQLSLRSYADGRPNCRDGALRRSILLDQY
jgi:Kringle domain